MSTRLRSLSGVWCTLPYLFCAKWICVLLFIQATNYYKLFITWTNQKIKNTFVQRNMFEFQHIKVVYLTLY